MKLFDKVVVNTVTKNTEKIKNMHINSENLSKSSETVTDNFVFTVRSVKDYVLIASQVKVDLTDQKNNLESINKLFEGQSKTITSDNVTDKFSFINKVSIDKEVYSISCSISPKVYCYNYTSKLNFYKVGLSLFPLTVHSNVGLSTYVYNIYKYISRKNFNFYTSCFISLFYYYFGLLSALICLYKHDHIHILSSNIVVIVAKLASFVTVLSSNYNNVFSGTVVSMKLMNIMNNSWYLGNETVCSYKPFLIGLTKYILVSSGVFAKLSFQETLQFFKHIIWEHNTDWTVDSKCNIILSNFTPIGSGWYRYFYN